MSINSDNHLAELEQSSASIALEVQKGNELIAQRELTGIVKNPQTIPLYKVDYSTSLESQIIKPVKPKKVKKAKEVKTPKPKEVKPEYKYCKVTRYMGKVTVSIALPQHVCFYGSNGLETFFERVNAIKEYNKVNFALTANNAYNFAHSTRTSKALLTGYTYTRNFDMLDKYKSIYPSKTVYYNQIIDDCSYQYPTLGTLYTSTKESSPIADMLRDIITDMACNSENGFDTEITDNTVRYLSIAACRYKRERMHEVYSGDTLYNGETSHDETIDKLIYRMNNGEYGQPDVNPYTQLLYKLLANELLNYTETLPDSYYQMYVECTNEREVGSKYGKVGTIGDKKLHAYTAKHTDLLPISTDIVKYGML